jgi:hypothetical protein
VTYWTGRAASAGNLRLYIHEHGWRSSAGEALDQEGRQLKAGASREISSILLNVLNATNVVVLTGTGSSFAAINPAGRLAPAGMWDVWLAVREAAGETEFDGLVAKFGKSRVGENIEKLLTLCKLYLELSGEMATDAAQQAMADFVRIAETAILRRVNFVDRETDLEAHGSLLRKIGRRSVRKPRAKLFTTNYDLCFEEVARRTRFTFIDGFSHNLDQIYDRTNFFVDHVRREPGRDSPDYLQNVLHFYKLHGSIDWRRVSSEIVRTREDVGSPVLIYPRSSKYQESFDAPYLDMLSAFQAALREPDTAVLVSGFGFNDDHISSPIMSAVEANLSLRLVICDPAFLSDDNLWLETLDIGNAPVPTNRFLLNFRRLVDAGDARVHLINGRFQDLAAALPDLVGETDRERHVQRMRSLRDAAELTV